MAGQGRWRGASSGDVFPGMGSAFLIGLCLGAACAVSVAWRNGQGIWGEFAWGLAGMAAGAAMGAFVAARWGIPHPSATPGAEGGPGVWDRWLDAEAVAERGADTAAEAEEVPDLPVPPLEPRRAEVRPRLISPESGESVLLEEEVGRFVERGVGGAIRINGPLGSGKTRALQHLAAVLPPDREVFVLDDPTPSVVARRMAEGLVVYSGKVSAHPKTFATYRLAPWGQDERIEYLLATAKSQCASVMARLKMADDVGWIGGNPELWSIVLDRMAGDPGLRSLHESLRAELTSRAAQDGLRPLAERVCLAILTGRGSEPGAVRELDELTQRAGVRLLRLIRHRPVQLLAAADRIAEDLAEGEPCECEYLGSPLPRDLVAEAGAVLRDRPGAVARLGALVAGPWRRAHPMAASLLHAAGTNWRPTHAPGEEPPRLVGAYLKQAAWRRVDLRSTELATADLAFADLRSARLDNARADGAHLRGARLAGASLGRASLQGADLRKADLSSVGAAGVNLSAARLEGADLTGAFLIDARLPHADLLNARLIGADLTRASLRGSRLDGADFTGAILDSADLNGLILSRTAFGNARFVKAELTHCNLEGMELPGVNFRGAQFVRAGLTGSRMPGADFRGASLQEAELAEIDWEGACLAGADLRGACFHLGSSRSGLVQSPIACEGSRTGFYTDDFDEQDFKAPEEIRKANLRGADLRGALIDGVDFYLVDLRGARFDADQAERFRRCGAILAERGR